MKTDLILFDNTSNIDDIEAKYSQVSMVECWKLNLIALYCFILLILSIIFNTVLLRTFYRYKELRSTLNVFVITLTALNLIGSLSELPIVTITNWYCRLVIYT